MKWPLSSKQVVFVVEDNDAYRILISNILMHIGYKVVQFSCAIEALKHVTNYMPKIIISDIQMPLMDGFEFFKALEKDYPFNAIPFIYISSSNKREDIETAARLSKRSMLSKPVVSDELCKVIDEILMD